MAAPPTPITEPIRPGMAECAFFVAPWSVPASLLVRVASDASLDVANPAPDPDFEDVKSSEGAEPLISSVSWSGKSLSVPETGFAP